MIQHFCMACTMQTPRDTLISNLTSSPYGCCTPKVNSNQNCFRRLYYKYLRNIKQLKQALEYLWMEFSSHSLIHSRISRI